MEKTLRVLNRMVRDDVIATYVIGGAIAAIFHIEPFETSDLDIFFVLQAKQSDLLVLAPLYDYLSRLGYHPSGEFVKIEGWQVQFLPVFNPLIEEAVEQSIEIKYNRTKTRIMSAEHLVAIMLETGRVKDYARIAQFLEEEAVDSSELMKVLTRHKLTNKWKSFRRRFQE